MAHIISFEDLVQRFGEVLAWHYVVEIEKAAFIQPRHSDVDANARLKRAYSAQDLQYASNSMAA